MTPEQEAAIRERDSMIDMNVTAWCDPPQFVKASQDRRELLAEFDTLRAENASLRKQAETNHTLRAELAALREAIAADFGDGWEIKDGRLHVPLPPMPSALFNSVLAAVESKQA